MKKTALIFYLTFCGFFGFSQINHYAVSNYHSSTGWFLNPSFGVDAKNHLDISLFSVNVGLMNNYAFFNRTARDGYAANSIGENYQENKKYRGNFLFETSLFSFSKVIEEHAFGFGIRARTNLAIGSSTDDLSSLIIKGPKHNFNQNKTLTTENTRVKALSWGEFDFNYGRILYKRNNEMITGGVTIKRLIGIFSASVLINEVSLSVDDFNFYINQMNAAYGVTVPSSSRQDKGWGADIGVTYKKSKNNLGYHIPHSPKSNCRESDYIFKLSASLLDIGRIKFSEAAFNRTFTSDSASLNDYQSLNATNVRELDLHMSDRLAANGVTVTETNEVVASLPFSMYLAGDYQYKNHYYVSGNAMLNLQRYRKYGVEQFTTFGATWRYERKHFEFAIPITQHLYRYPQVGFFLRAYFLSIGMNSIGQIVSDSKIFGTNAYVNLRFGFNQTSKCKNHKKTQNWWCPKYKKEKEGIRKFRLEMPQPFKSFQSKKYKN